MLANLSPADRVRRFIGELARAPHLDQQIIHAFHTGHEREASLLVSDLWELLKIENAAGAGDLYYLLLQVHPLLETVRRKLSGRNVMGEVIEAPTLGKLDKIINRIGRRLED
jgi:hypothetical protein